MSQLKDLLGQHPSSPNLRARLAALTTAAGLADVPQPDVKAYSDAVYFNYYTLGLSVLFTPAAGYKPSSGTALRQLELQKLVLDSMDIFAVPKSSTPGPTKSSTASVYANYPLLPITFSLSSKTTDGKDRPTSFDVTAATTGKDFVAALGEPDRKGGGAGPSSGSIGIWCEWSKDGLMVEFGGEEARGPQAWERGKDAVWKVITLFAPKV